jgi:hypothetical protein
VPDDDIAYWTRERDKLLAQLAEIEGPAISADMLPTIQYLRTRIGDIERHIASLERRRL